MEYTPTKWVDNGLPAINAKNLNKIEEGIQIAHDEIEAIRYSYGTADLTAGTSKLETGKLHFVYEDK